MNIIQTIRDLFAKTDKPDDGKTTMNTDIPFDRDAHLTNFEKVTQAHYNYKHLQGEFDQLVRYIRAGDRLAPVFQWGFYGEELVDSYWAMLQPDPRRWDATDQRLLAFGLPKKVGRMRASFYQVWLTNRLNESLDDDTIARLVPQLDPYGVAQNDFWVDVLAWVNLDAVPDSDLAKWVLARVERYHRIGLPRLQDDLIPYLKLLLRRKSDFVRTHWTEFLPLKNYNNRLGVDPKLAKELLAGNASFYGPHLAALKPQITDPGSYRTVQQLLAQHLPGRYEADTLAAAYEYLDLVLRVMTTGPTHGYFMSRERGDGKLRLTAALMFDLVLQHEEPAKAREYLDTWLRACPTPDIDLFKVLSERLEQASVPFLMLGLQLDPKGLYINEVELAKGILRLLAQYDYSTYHPQIWAMARHKSKQMRELAAVTLAKLGEVAIPEAEKLLNDKKAEARQTGALILSLIKTERALTLLHHALDNERNDDARDLMLDSLTGLLPVPATPDEVAVLVLGAKKRGKLDAPVFGYLPENKLPDLFWKATGQPLNTETIRFLIYRQSRSKDIRPDAEVRPLYDLIDRDRSSAFAGAVLKAYFEAGADAKGKACLTIGGMLGGEAETDALKAKVNQWAEGSRGKMAEYAVQALALIGSNRALRAVEFFSRKYKSKNKNIGAAANEAFTIAAETLGISPYDLADSIIPDFEFEGLFREFEAGGETYRAFVDTDFKLAFLNEDNKLSKSVPKATPTALKDEFKEIGKEIRDIVKAQSGRLEQYLVVQRKWPADRWQAFFMGNPVMFAYAVRLIWGVFDAEQTLLFTFQCQEDQALLNADGDEIDLVDVANGLVSIGMVHPLSLTFGKIAYWTEQLADAGIEPIFPQLNRRVVTLPETDRNLTIDRQFTGVEYGGYGFVSKMDKLGWRRGSIQDGGWIASFYKDFSDLGITAIVMQQGNISMGYYDENAALGNLMFVHNGSVQFGSYSYDDPDKAADPRLIAFGQVPPIVYAEVMADLEFFRENDLKKNHDN